MSKHPLNRQPGLRPWLAAAAGLAVVGTSELPAQAVRPVPQTPAEEDRTIVLSPFTVDASRDRGYFAENTLAGSRLNSNIGDLASAISVVTKQQLEDTASVDINDVFLYELNTEGLHNYTQIAGPNAGNVVDRGTIKDFGAGYGWGNNPNSVFTSATANRIRGIAAPDPAVNFYPGIARIPFDTYNTQSVEINRGPNAVLFGVGTPAGIVNQTTATALLNRNTYEVQLRAGSWDSYRASMNFNQTLIRDRLAIYGAAVYDERGFQRKPSEDTTERYYLALTARPWPKTTIRASYEYYDNFNRRPNYLTPVDTVSGWLAEGRPVYNPVTRIVTYMDTGASKGPYVFSSASPGYNPALHLGTQGSGPDGRLNADGTIRNPDAMLTGGSGFGPNHPLYVRSLTWQPNYGQPVLAVHNSQGTYLPRHPVWPVTPAGMAGALPAVNARTAEQWAYLERRPTMTDAGRFQPTRINAAGLLENLVQGYVLPGVTDKNIYNWEKVNINSMNFGEENADTFNIELEQEIFRDLHLQVGWFRQEMEARSNYIIGQQTGAILFVDTNTHLANGQTNPFFGQPFVRDWESDTFHNPEKNESLRATLAYDLDFRNNRNWSRWLGRHRLMGLWTEQDRTQYATRSRFTAIPPSDPRYMNTNITTANYNYAANGRPVSNRFFYLGETGGTPGVVTQAAGFWGNPGPTGGDGPTSGVIPTYNWATGQWEDANVTLSTETWHPGTGANNRVITSMSGAIQSFLWEDRIVATVGWRQDEVRSRMTPVGLIDTAAESEWYHGGFIRAGDFYNRRWGPRQEFKANTMSKGVVFHGLRWGDGRHRLSFHYNESDNFTPPPAAQYDFFGNAHDKPAGSGKDYGISASLFDNKLVARLNWFEVLSTGERVDNNLLQRTARMDWNVVRHWAEMVVRYLGGEDTTANFGNNQLRPLNSQQEARIIELSGQPLDWPNFPIRDTQDVSAEGIELQVTYNPIPNWTMKLSAGSQDTRTTNTTRAWQAWADVRIPFWQNLRVPQGWIDQAPADRRNLNNLDITFGQNPGQDQRQLNLLNFWSGTGFGTDPAIRATATNGWTTPSGYWGNAVEPEIVFARQNEGRSALNQRKYRGSLVTNYEFVEGRFLGWSTGGALRWEDRAIAGYYGVMDADGIMRRPDIDRPIYVSSNTDVDLWLAYRTRIFSDRVGLRVQLNVRNVFEDGGLTPVYYNLDGSAAAFRIKDPRQFMLTATFSF
jgi:hypothetical protein